MKFGKFSERKVKFARSSHRHVGNDRRPSFSRQFTIDVVDDFFSGPILISWRKLLPYTTDLRQRYQRETWSEWFQWLAERMMERESKTAAVPAYIAHRDWKKL
jgi:hypothetical protein